MRHIINSFGKIIKTNIPLVSIRQFNYTTIRKTNSTIKTIQNEKTSKIDLDEYIKILNLPHEKYAMADISDNIIKKCLEFGDKFKLKIVCKKIAENISYNSFRAIKMKIPLLCKEVIRKKPMILGAIPNNIQNYYLCNLSNEISKGKSFMYVYPEHQTYDMALQAVKYQGNNLKYVREDLLDNQIITTAIKSDGEAIKYVKNPTRENYIDAINSNPYSILSIKEMDNSLYMLAIKKNPMVLQCIGESEQTDEMCKYAVSNSNNEWILGYVKKQTLEICEIAIKKNPEARCYVKINTEELL